MPLPLFVARVSRPAAPRAAPTSRRFGPFSLQAFYPWPFPERFMATDAEKHAHNSLISAAWGAGHDQAAQLWGEDRVPSYFTGPEGEVLMGKLQALPVGTGADEFARVVTEHVTRDNR